MHAMDLKKWLDSERGRAMWLATAIGVPPSFVSKIACEIKSAPAERCAAIEQATAGEVTRRDLRPADWGAIWPELIDALHPWPPRGEVIKPDSAVPLNISRLEQAFVEVDLGALPVHAANDSAGAGAPGPVRA